ncbi:MAG: YdiU family protein [Myxococcota bacterium]
MHLRLDDRFLRDLPADPLRTPGRASARRGLLLRRPHARAGAPPARAVGRGRRAARRRPRRGPRRRRRLGGQRIPAPMRPYAANYGGHQFGHWAGQLGDGRAITLGAVARPDGPLEVQLKGAGPTPYSRTADGRAVLRSSVREFLCSEAVHHLGIPTTRALALLTTGAPVLRDMFYDGHAAYEPGAIVVRVAPSFLRVGNFELFASRGELDTLRALVDHTLRVHFPGCDGPVAMLAEVAERSAHLAVAWQRVGFVHGVLNTDNLSVLGLTLDYGPYGWLEGYDPDWTPNTTDAGRRRYRFDHQPSIVGWNVARLAEALLPLVGAPEPLQEALDRYGAVVEPAYRQMRCDKLGLGPFRPEDAALLREQDAVLQLVETDYTLFHRALATVDPPEGADDDVWLAPLADSWYAAPDAAARARIAAWLRAWRARARDHEPDAAARRAAMDAVNPLYVLRNWLAQLAIDRAAAGDADGITELLEVLRRPYEVQPGREAFADKRPEWARSRPGCSMLSCSS